MEIRKADGSFLTPDDAIFEPIYNDIQKHHRTLIAHLAEPDVRWQPPDPNNPELSYFRDNPRWYMYLHPDYPSKKAILAARDHILEKNPKLRFIGAHMGSMESNVDQIAARLDKYPNFAVETGDRLCITTWQYRWKSRPSCGSPSTCARDISYGIWAKPAGRSCAVSTTLPDR